METTLSPVEGTSLCNPLPSDIPKLCQWITDTGELGLISGEKGTTLSEEVCNHWIQSAETAIVVRYKETPIAFASLSQAEADLPAGEAELCHLIVDPRYRRRYNGSHLVLALTTLARDASFKKVVGRVVPGNAVGMAIIGSLGWRPLPPSVVPPTSDDLWFSKSL